MERAGWVASRREWKEKNLRRWEPPAWWLDVVEVALAVPLDERFDERIENARSLEIYPKGY